MEKNNKDKFNTGSMVTWNSRNGLKHTGMVLGRIKPNEDGEVALSRSLWAYTNQNLEKYYRILRGLKARDCKFNRTSGNDRCLVWVHNGNSMGTIYAPTFGRIRSYLPAPSEQVHPQVRPEANRVSLSFLHRRLREARNKQDQADRMYMEADKLSEAAAQEYKSAQSAIEKHIAQVRVVFPESQVSDSTKSNQARTIESIARIFMEQTGVN